MRRTALLLVALLTPALTVAPGCKPEKEMSAEEKAKLIAEKLEEGEAKLRSQQSDLAKKSFEKVLEIEAGHPGALRGLAQVHAEKEEWKEAEKYATDALAKSADDPYLHETMGKIFAATDRHKEAAASYGKAFEMKPNLSDWGINKGKAERNAGDLETSHATLLAISKDDPEATHIFSELGETVRKQGKLDEALELFMRAQVKSESDKNAFLGAARVYEAKGETTKALDQYSAYKQRDCCSTFSKTEIEPKLSELNSKEQGELAEKTAKPPEGEAPAEGGE